MGFKTRDNLAGIPNTDPLRMGHPDLPPEACEVPNQQQLNDMAIATMHYYLPPSFDVDNADALALTATAPLQRRKR